MSMSRLVVVGIAIAMVALGGSAQAADKREVVFVSGVGGATPNSAAAPLVAGTGHYKPASETVPQSSLLPTSLPQFPADYQVDDDSLDED